MHPPGNAKARGQGKGSAKGIFAHLSSTDQDLQGRLSGLNSMSIPSSVAIQNLHLAACLREEEKRGQRIRRNGGGGPRPGKTVSRPVVWQQAKV